MTRKNRIDKLLWQFANRENAATDQAREEAKGYLGKECNFLDGETLCASADYSLGRLDRNQRKMYEQDKDRVESHLKQCPLCSFEVLEAIRSSADNIAAEIMGNDTYRIANELETLIREQEQNDETKIQ